VGHAELSGRLARISAWLLSLVWLAELGALAGAGRPLSIIAAAGLSGFVAIAVLRASRHIRLLFLLIAGSAAFMAFSRRASRIGLCLPRSMCNSPRGWFD